MFDIAGVRRFAEQAENGPTQLTADEIETIAGGVEDWGDSYYPLVDEANYWYHHGFSGTLENFTWAVFN